MPSSEPLTSGATPSADEVVRLREEVARLRASLAARGRAPRRHGRWRPVVAGLLIALAALLAPLSVLATWASGQIQDTDRYLETVAPLANDPDVQDAIATRIEQVVFSYLDLDAATDELVTALQAPGLPPRAVDTLSALSGPLAGGVRSFVRDRIDVLVGSAAFETAWVEANRTAHTELVAALTGTADGVMQVDRGQVSVNLAVVIDTVKTQLLEAGFDLADRIPAVEASYTLVRSDDLYQVQRLLGFVDGLALWLPVLGLALVAAAVVVGRDRARVLVAAGLAVAASMLLLGAALNGLRPFYLETLPVSSSAAAAGAFYDQLVGFIRLSLRGVLVVALTIAAVAWLSSPGGAGAAARRSLGSWLGAVRRGREGAGLGTGRVGVVLARYRGPLRVLLVGVAALGYLSRDHPSGGTALSFVLATGAALLLVDVLAADAPVGDEPMGATVAGPTEAR